MSLQHFKNCWLGYLSAICLFICISILIIKERNNTVQNSQSSDEYTIQNKNEKLRRILRDQKIALRKKRFEQELERVKKNPSAIFDIPENMRADISYQYVYGLAVYGNSPSGYNQGHFISNSDKSEHAQNKIAVFRSFALKAGVPKYIISEACDDGRENAKHLWRH